MKTLNKLFAFVAVLTGLCFSAMPSHANESTTNMTSTRSAEEDLFTYCRYSVICIINETNQTLSYSFKWGNNGFQGYSVNGNGSSHWHAWRLSKPGAIHEAPNATLSFDSQLCNGDYWENWNLQGGCSPDESCENGAQIYRMRYEGSGNCYVSFTKN
jgi:hypothetical protein